MLQIEGKEQTEKKLVIEKENEEAKRLINPNSKNFNEAKA